MKNISFLFVLISILIISCEKNEVLPLDNYKVNEQKEDVILSNDSYLIFKDQESYNRISEALDRMTDNEFLNWEKELGFQSAQTYLSLVSDRIENLKTIEEFEALKQEFSNKLVFEDGSVRLPFYATAWDRVLTVDGIMKIGNKLFKFEKDRELIIRNGELRDLNNLKSLESDTSRVSVFYPLKQNNESNLKSLSWGTLLTGRISTGSSFGDSRLTYSLQLISFNYKGYGVTNPPVYYTEAGFQFKLDLYQQRVGIFGWFWNETMYYFNGESQHIEYYQPEQWYDYYYDNVFIGKRKRGGDHVVEIKSFPDATYGETKLGCTYTFHYYYFVGEYKWSFVEPQIYSFGLTFYSRGIGSENKITLNYSNL